MFYQGPSGGVVYPIYNTNSRNSSTLPLASRSIEYGNPSRAGPPGPPPPSTGGRFDTLSRPQPQAYPQKQQWGTLQHQPLRLSSGIIQQQQQQQPHQPPNRRATPPSASAPIFPSRPPTQGGPANGPIPQGNYRNLHYVQCCKLSPSKSCSEEKNLKNLAEVCECLTNFGTMYHILKAQLVWN